MGLSGSQKVNFNIDIVNLSDLKKEIGSETLKTLLSNFFCKINPDVQYFLREKSIPFSDSRKGTTYLIIGKQDNEEAFICAYFTISIKAFVFTSVSNSKRKSLVGHYDYRNNEHPSILIGQIGKNDNAPYIIEGKDLFKSIFTTILNASDQISGAQFIVLESVNAPKLIENYKKYGFKELFNNNHELDLTDDGLVKMTMTMDKLISFFG